MNESFLNRTIELHCGDCLAVLPTLAENSIDSCVTDPPYGIGFMGKEWDSGKSFVERKAIKTNTFDHVGGNHNPTNSADAARTRRVEGQKFGAWCEDWASEVYRVLKPGAHLLAFGGTRTYHRMACAIEDAGFEIRDCIMWVYGSGFPKSHSVSIAIDKQDGVAPRSKGFNMKGRGERADELDANGREFLPPYEAQSAAARQWEGWGTALKPACEPIVLARKPLSEKTVAANVLRWGTGAINVDGCRIPINRDVDDPRLGNGGTWSTAKMAKNVYEGGYTGVRVGSSEKGRWPANLIHDGSEEVLAGFPDADGATSNGRKGVQGLYSDGIGAADQMPSYGDFGSAARFFYTAKADSDDRLGSKHPTVKPLDLMQYLVRLVTPKGDTVLDPFAGTGTTGEAAWREGMRAVLIEREAEYQADIRRRMALVLSGPDERVREAIKARMKDKPRDDGPLFA